MADTSVLVHLAQAALLLRRAAHREDIADESARIALNAAATLQLVLELLDSKGVVEASR